MIEPYKWRSFKCQFSVLLRTYLEKKRRTDMVNQLRTNLKKFEQMLVDENSSKREALLVDFEGANTAVTETNETLNVNTHQLLYQHDRILEGSY